MLESRDKTLDFKNPTNSSFGTNHTSSFDVRKVHHYNVVVATNKPTPGINLSPLIRKTHDEAKHIQCRAQSSTHDHSSPQLPHHHARNASTSSAGNSYSNSSAPSHNHAPQPRT